MNRGNETTTSSGGRAVIGPSTVVNGEISGEEDLLVEGKVDGKIRLRENAVTVGAKGRITAEVHARAVLIDGEVEGNISAEEQVVVRKSGRVRGDVTAPRVTIEDGASFKGSIDMEPKRSGTSAATATMSSSARPAPAVKSESAAPSLAAAAVSSSSPQRPRG